MRSLLIAAIVATAVTGCAMPTDDLLNNKFLEAQNAPVPDGMAGIWTGTIGPSLVTDVIYPDGTGLECSETVQATREMSKLKLSNGKMYMQVGLKYDVQYSGNTMKLVSRYLGGGEYTFYKDDTLDKASVYCKEALPKQIKK